MSKKYKKVCTSINYNISYLASTSAGCISNSGFTSLSDIPIGITSSAIGLEICAIVA